MAPIDLIAAAARADHYPAETPSASLPAPLADYGYRFAEPPAPTPPEARLSLRRPARITIGILFALLVTRIALLVLDVAPSAP